MTGSPRRVMFGLRWRLVVTLVVAMLGLVVVFRTVWLPGIDAALTRTLQREVANELDVLGEALVPHLLQNRSAPVYETLANLQARRPHWHGLIMVDAAGVRLFPIDPPRPLPLDSLDMTAPVTVAVRHGDRVLASISVSADMTADKAVIEQANMRVRAFGLGLALLLLALLLWAVDRSVGRPMAMLEAAAARLARRDFGAALPPVRNDEIGRLTESFARMREEIAQHEAMLTRARQAAESAVETRTRFLATMSHEMRTPLNGVVPVADMLLETDLTPQQRHQVKVIRDSGKALAALLGNLLELSALDAGDVVVQPVPTDIAALLDQVQRALAVFGEQKGLPVTLDIAPSVHGCWLVDGARLRQILLNLGFNAIKFTAEGHVALTARAGSEGIEIAVADTGIGIAPEHHDRVFERFGQVDTGLDRRFEGTGLGLPISLALAKAMGGDITLDSRPGHGAVFRLTLAASRIGTAGRDGCAAVPGVGPDNRPLHVLVVDDSAINREVALAMVKREGHKSSSAENGAAALAFLATQPVDLVLMDVQMPEIDGLAATRQIRAMPGPVARTPVVGLSAGAFGEDVQKALAAGMDDYLAKPLTAEALRATLARVTGRGRSPDGGPPPAA